MAIPGTDHLNTDASCSASSTPSLVSGVQQNALLRQVFRPGGSQTPRSTPAASRPSVTQSRGASPEYIHESDSGGIADVPAEADDRQGGVVGSDDSDSDDDDSDEDGGEVQKSGHTKERPLHEWEVQRMKAKEVRKEMEESLAKEWGDLAKVWWKPSLKKKATRPHKPKSAKSSAAPSCRSTRMNASEPGGTNVNPPSEDEESLHAHTGNNDNGGKTSQIVPTSDDGDQTPQITPMNIDGGETSQTAKTKTDYSIERRQWPEWLCQAMDSFADDERLADLEGLLAKFVALERQMGYLTGMVRLNIMSIGILLM
jgi:hypothetical protein